MERAVIRPLTLLATYPRKPGERLPSRLKVWPRNSPGIRTANYIFTGGTAGVNQDGQVVTPEDPANQVKVALDRLRLVIAGGGVTLADVFRLRWFLTAPSDLHPVMRGVAEYLAEHTRDDAWPVMSQVVGESSSGVIRAEIESMAATSYETITVPNLFKGLATGVEWPNYAHATRVGNVVYCSGQLPLDRHGSIVGTTANEQTNHVLGTISDVLSAAGLTPRQLVKLTIWIDQADDSQDVLATVSAWLKKNGDPACYPAATSSIAALAVPGARVQIEAIATSGRRESINSREVYQSLPRGLLHSQAVKVSLGATAESWLRKFTWPDDWTEEDRAQLGAHLERAQDLGHLLFMSAMAPLAADGTLAGPDMATQAHQVFTNLKYVTEAAGGRFADIVQFDIYYANQSVYNAYNEERVRFVEQHQPDKDWFPGSGVEGTSCIPGALMELEAIAAID